MLRINGRICKTYDPHLYLRWAFLNDSCCRIWITMDLGRPLRLVLLTICFFNLLDQSNLKSRHKEKHFLLTISLLNVSKPLRTDWEKPRKVRGWNLSNLKLAVTAKSSALSQSIYFPKKNFSFNVLLRKNWSKNYTLSKTLWCDNLEYWIWFKQINRMQESIQKLTSKSPHISVTFW